MVFNRFWRADPARARTSGGTGLGLSISLEDTHLHGGWLQAWGRPGEGAQFRLTLPRRAGGALRQSPLPLVPEDAAEPVAMSAGAVPALARRCSPLARGRCSLLPAASRLPDDRPGGRDADVRAAPRTTAGRVHRPAAGPSRASRRPRSSRASSTR